MYVSAYCLPCVPFFTFPLEKLVLPLQMQGQVLGVGKDLSDFAMLQKWK